MQTKISSLLHTSESGRIQSKLACSRQSTTIKPANLFASINAGTGTDANLNPQAQIRISILGMWPKLTDTDWVTVSEQVQPLDVGEHWRGREKKIKNHSCIAPVQKRIPAAMRKYNSIKAYSQQHWRSTLYWAQFSCALQVRFAEGKVVQKPAVSFNEATPNVTDATAGEEWIYKTEETPTWR